MFQIQSQSLRPLTTAHLAQTMTLLQMNSAELAQKIERDLSQNPALELLDERRCPTCKRKLVNPGPCPVCSRPTHASPEEPIVFVSAREDFIQGQRGATRTYQHDAFLDDDIPAKQDDLPTYVMRQIAFEIAPEDRAIAAQILTSLNDDGLLSSSIFEISRYHHVPPSRVENVLRLIRRADPIGVGATSVEEALLTQIEVLSETQDVPALAKRAVRKHLSLLSRRQYAELAKRLGCSLTEAKEIAHFIGSNLNPYPGRAHWGDAHQGNGSNPPVYHRPDILLYPLDNRRNSPLVVEILSSSRGVLHINPLFKQALSDAPAENIEKWKADLEQANLLIKCIQQRNHTIQRLMAYLARKQREFILHGDRFSQPITRAKVAKTLGVHESTISRAVSGKTVQLPSGRIIPMEQFFDRSLHIRAIIRSIIRDEQEILTDTQIAAHLAMQGHRIARRTVAKYRAMEGILPAHLRRNMRKA